MNLRADIVIPRIAIAGDKNCQRTCSWDWIQIFFWQNCRFVNDTIYQGMRN